MNLTECEDVQILLAILRPLQITINLV